MATSVLTREVLEEVHTAAEYLQWARALIALVREEQDGIERIRLRIGLAKELMNEAFPLGLLASKYFAESDEVRIQLKIGNQTHDAIVSDTRARVSPVKFVEATLASEGEDDYLRMRVLHEQGHVSGLGRVTKSGTQRTGLKIQVEPQAVSQAEVLQRERTCVVQALERKLGKSYPANTLLLVGFNDEMAHDRPDNIANLESAVSAYLPRLKAFHSVAIVGLSQGLFMSWRTGSAI